jgi:hypothetical protein
MHFWPNPSITKTTNAFNFKKVKANRPKEISDKDWNEIIAEEKLAKLVALNAVPKASRREEKK